MTDELKAEEEKVKTILSAMNADASKATFWASAHSVWLIGFGAFVLGVMVGHWVHL
jgi:hypothetical protein